jgi:hypothetical protein
MFLCDLNNKHFIESEFKDISLQDKRLDNRVKTICEDLLHANGSTVKNFSSSASDARCAYDFFSNVKVFWKELHSPHVNQSINRINNLEADQDILLLHDTTVLNYTTHEAKRELGKIGKGNKDYYGVLQHTTLGITANNIPLGVLNLNYFNYDEYESSLPRHERSIQEKATFRWCDALNKTQKLASNSKAKVIHIADREADFYDFLSDAKDSNCNFIVRCSHVNRTINLHDNKGPLIKQISQAPIIGKTTIAVYNKQTGLLENKDFEVQVLLKVIINKPKKTNSQSTNVIECSIVCFTCQDLQWYLLTNLNVNDLQSAIKIGDYYKMRWHIESYFKVLKTSFKAEEIRLHQSKQAILNLLTLLNIMSFEGILDYVSIERKT